MDIPYLISGLQKAGLTQTQIGNAIGLKQPTVSEMATGKAGITRPSYTVVSKLTALAKRHGVRTTPPKPTKPDPK